MLPYGNIHYHKAYRRLKCSRAGTMDVPCFRAFQPNKGARRLTRPAYLDSLKAIDEHGASIQQVVSFPRS